MHKYTHVHIVKMVLASRIFLPLQLCTSLWYSPQNQVGRVHNTAPQTVRAERGTWQEKQEEMPYGTDKHGGCPLQQGQPSTAIAVGQGQTAWEFKMLFYKCSGNSQTHTPPSTWHLYSVQLTIYGRAAKLVQILENKT